MQELAQQVLNGVVLGSAYALVALGLLLIFGVLNIPNFAHGEMFMVAALVTGMLVAESGLPYVPASAAGLVLVAGLGLVLYKGVFAPLEKAPHIAMLIAALAVSIILQEVAALAFGTTPFGIGQPVAGVVSFADLRVSTFRLLIIGVVLLGVVLVWWLVNRTSFGRQMRALAQNADAALLVGINVPRIAALTFMVGSMLAGLAGILLAGTQPLSPSVGFYPTLIAFAILVVGGVGSIFAAVAGGFAVGIIETLVVGYVGANYRTLAVFALVVVVLAFRPEGAVGRRSVL